jgi:hypothetical protein
MPAVPTGQRPALAECLRSLQADFVTVAINLRMTTMQGGERLVLEGTCVRSSNPVAGRPEPMTTACA